MQLWLYIFVSLWADWDLTARQREPMTGFLRAGCGCQLTCANIWRIDSPPKDWAHSGELQSPGAQTPRRLKTATDSVEQTGVIKGGGSIKPIQHMDMQLLMVRRIKNSYLKRNYYSKIRFTSKFKVKIRIWCEYYHALNNKSWKLAINVLSTTIITA